MILWDGYCPTHARILKEHVLAAKKSHPGAEVLVHPECRPEVIDLAERVLSTTGICRHARESAVKEFINRQSNFLNINENDAFFDVLITLSATTQLNVTADISYVGSANHPLDYYFSPALPSVLITAGSTSQIVTVYLENDSNYEASETIFFNIVLFCKFFSKTN